jgi:hypothetical protein
MSNVVRHRQRLWHFGTRWLTLRASIRDSNRARWPVAPAWAQLAGACIGGSAVLLIRENIRAANLDRLTQDLVGYRRRRQHLRQTPP